MNEIQPQILFVGGGMLVAALVMGGKTLAFMRKAKRAKGVIVGREEYSSEDQWLARPRVQFETEEGKRVTFTSSVGRNHSRVPLYGEVRVLYDPRSPHQAMIDSFWDTWFIEFGLTVFGLIIIVAALHGAIRT